MAAPQQAKLDDSNIANYGSGEHRDLRQDAAESEAAFLGAGQAPGVEVWRVENFGLARVAKRETGTFYMGDSYIVLYTYTEKDSPKLKYNLHFWLGKDTTQDEYGTAAYKTVELDDLLNDEPVQYREVQGYEGPEFRRLFPRMRLLEGGVDSGFNEVKPEEYHPRLLHVKGKEFVQVVQVPLRAKSLNEGDVFLLDAGLRVFQWNGPSSNHHERRRANEAVQQIKEDRNGKPSSEVVDGLEDHEEFWGLLGGAPEKLAPATPDDVEPPRRAIYRLSDASGKMRFEELATTTEEFNRELLDSNDAFIVDTGVTVYSWVGRGASAEERKQAIRFAMQYLDENDRPLVTPVVRVVEGGEPLAFQRVFDEPPPEVPAAAAARAAAEAKEAGGFDGLLTVTCHEARNLTNVQSIGKQDPYMRIKLGKKLFQTKVHRDGVSEATWNETYRMEIAPKDTELKLSVLNQNIVIDKTIGKVRLPLEELLQTASHADRWVTVMRGDEVAGEVRVTITYTKPYVLRAVRAEGLKSCQLIGKMDPYVRFVHGKEKRKSKHVENGDKDPVWEPEHEAVFRYNLTNFAPTEVLTMEVRNKNPVSDDLIAGTGANVGNIIKAANAGEPMVLPLVTKSGKPSGKLYLRVSH